MKKYILSILCVFSLQGMEEVKQTRESREWSAQDYSNGNFMQEEGALKLLEKSGINFENEEILDVGCGTGNITAILAKTAQYVHGIDASKNLIEYAQEHYANDNLTFEHVFAEDFTPSKQFHKAFSFACLHWLKDKRKVFENLNKSLKNNGEFFGSTISASDPASLGVAVLEELLEKLRPACPFLQNTTITPESSNRHVISDEEFKEIIKATGFEIISYKKTSPGHHIVSREQLAAFRRPIMMSRPLFKALSDENKEWLFNQYIDLFLEKLERDESNNYVYNGTIMTVVHARKIAEV